MKTPLTDQQRANFAYLAMTTGDVASVAKAAGREIATIRRWMRENRYASTRGHGGAASGAMTEAMVQATTNQAGVVCSGRQRCGQRAGARVGRGLLDVLA